ncbi:hypothetical protein DF3PA_330019 [Candidatus Defluviicoccus seviourii]|uniref:Uncharacterized protein n=1 Tax=Candidatus Defluviicoccus seviourii TaxID=2565273 RepID=A0A564WGC1_9PROT|nr:hypothetical protein DF3PA_330019 [Candidatus Defluviicoccus seviourii]
MPKVRAIRYVVQRPTLLGRESPDWVAARVPEPRLRRLKTAVPVSDFETTSDPSATDRWRLDASKNPLDAVIARRDSDEVI